MRAAFYDKLGPARLVLQVAELPDPVPGAGEVRVRIHASGVNPSDVKMRLDTGSTASDYPRIIPHSDGAGNIAWLPHVMADYGLLAVYGSSQREVPVGFGPSILGNIGYRFFIVYNQPSEMRARTIAALTAMLQGNKLKHSIAATYALEGIAAAHEAVESGKVMGNVVVKP